MHDGSHTKPSMEMTRLLGKILFSQCAELINPCNEPRSTTIFGCNRCPSLDYHAKGIDIAATAYVAELEQLANSVLTYIQSAEMHNQAVKYVLHF